MDAPVGISIFCDDIRFEQGNKLTFVGCYGTEMLISGPLPALLPRLGIFVQLRLPAGTSSPSQIRVYFPDSKDDEPAYVMDIAAPSAETIKKSQETPSPDIVPILASNVPILLGPVVIAMEGLIKVRVEWGGKTIKAGTIKIRHVGTEGAISPNASQPPV